MIKKNSVIELVGEKFERRLSEEISGVNQRISDEIAGVNHRIEQLRAELKEDIANLRTELSEKIAVSHANLIKWMFIFWIGQFVSMFGLLFVFLR